MLKKIHILFFIITITACKPNYNKEYFKNDFIKTNGSKIIIKNNFKNNFFQANFLDNNNIILFKTDFKGNNSLTKYNILENDFSNCEINIEMTKLMYISYTNNLNEIILYLTSDKDIGGDIHIYNLKTKNLFPLYKYINLMDTNFYWNKINNEELYYTYKPKNIIQKINKNGTNKIKVINGFLIDIKDNLILYSTEIDSRGQKKIINFEKSKEIEIPLTFQNLKIKLLDDRRFLIILSNKLIIFNFVTHKSINFDLKELCPSIISFNLIESKNKYLLLKVDFQKVDRKWYYDIYDFFHNDKIEYYDENLLLIELVE